MQREKDIVLVKDVEEYMISIILLGLLAIIDFMKKEIHSFILLPVVVIWLCRPILNKEVKISGIVAAVFLIMFSLAVKQAFGMADAIVLSLIALTDGAMNMLMIFFAANIFLIIFVGIRLGFKQKNIEIPFIPFIFIIFVLSKIVLKGEI